MPLAAADESGGPTFNLDLRPSVGSHLREQKAEKTMVNKVHPEIPVSHQLLLASVCYTGTNVVLGVSLTSPRDRPLY